MSRGLKNWLIGIAATMVTALVLGVGTVLAADHDKVTAMFAALPRIEAKLTAIENLLLQRKQ